MRMIDVARLRKSLGLNQAAFAELLGVNQGTVSRLERGGKQSGPMLLVLQRLDNERVERETRERDDVKPAPETAGASR